MFVVGRLLFVVCWLSSLSFVDCGSLCVVCCLLFAACGLVVDVCCELFVLSVCGLMCLV